MTTSNVARFAALFLATALTTVGCDTADEETQDGALRTVSWQLDGLEPLGDAYVYEGWVIIDDAPVSTGRFTVTEDQTSISGAIDIEGADASSKFVLTIEPAQGDDPAPSATKLLGGDFAGGTASLSIGDPAALGDDYTAAGGQFLLETPTSEEPEDYANGIWFLDAAAGTPSLDLPELPEGWAYEGWIVTEDGPISTGRFTGPSGEDSDGAGPTAGPLGFPGYPGQDFIDPAMSLVGTTAVISIEPEPDDSPAPFVLKPLVMPSIEDVADKGLQTMDNNAGASPTGTARLADPV